MTPRTVKPLRLLRIALLALIALPLAASAQAYPSRTVRLVVPYAAGGGVDTVARALAQDLGEALGGTVIVDNRPGANSMIGTEYVAKSAADGYTLLVTLVSHYAMPFLARNLPYDPVKDFAPITILGKAPQSLLVNAGVPVTSVAELIAYVKKNPGKVSFATSGAGTSQHLGGELLNVMAKLDMVHVPYKGGGPAMNDLLGAQVPVALLLMSNALPHARAGRIRILGVIESRRARAAPEVPTLAEAGVPGFAVPDTWIGIMGPAGLPPNIVSRVDAELARVIERPAVRGRLEAAGFEVNVVQTAEFTRSAVPTTEAYRKITSDAKIKPE
jgi:tripartite-type tricarboxylate transporter receptor subunit TctC